MHLVCLKCGGSHPAAPGATLCPECGGVQDVVYDYGRLRHEHDRAEVEGSTDPTMWRWSFLLPVPSRARRPRLRTGHTPLYPARRLGEALGVPDLWLKDEGANPTGSLKDRASAICVVKAQEAGAEVVACASSGNAAASLAGAAAAVGLKAVIFVPHYAAPGKVAQLLIYGAKTVCVEGSYLETFNLAEAAIKKYGWYSRQAAYNPYLVEGKKTAGLEIAEYFKWDVPDWVAVAVGDGCTVGGIAKAFLELKQLGWIDRLPRVLGVQAEGARAIHDYFHSGKLVPTGEDTLADGISVGVPRNPDKAVRNVRATGGTMLTVTDAEILQAMALTGRLGAVFAEPSAAASVAGVKKAREMGVLRGGERVCTVITGNGLKDTPNAIKAAGQPVRVKPDLAALEVLR